MPDYRQLQPDPPFGPDLPAVIREDHAHIASLLDQLVEADDPGARRRCFDEVAALLARHEVAEEEVVYPHLGRLGDRGSALRGARLSEEQSGKRRLARMSRRSLVAPGSRRFHRDCRRLREEVRRHAAAEEAEVLPLLQGEDDTRLRVMATMFEAARRTAPTRPHPRLPPNRPVLLGAAPVVGTLDRARDAGRRLLLRALGHRR